MAYIKYKGNKVLRTLNHSQLMAELSGEDIPEELTEEFLKKHNIAEVPSCPTPSNLKEDKYHRLGFEYKKVKGKWTREVVLVPVHAWEVDSRYEEKCKQVRDRRNSLLQETDWTQLGDVERGVGKKYLSYRQKLRDIPEQEGFPFTVGWPTPPRTEVE